MKYFHPKRYYRKSKKYFRDLFLYYIMPDKMYLKYQYRISCGKKLNLDNPKRFTEKIQWLKLYDRNPDYSRLVDKYEVKDIVAEIIGEEYIIPTLGVWDKFDDINFDLLPNQFVLKGTHDSASVIICEDKKKFNYKSAENKLKASLKIDYYRFENKQWAYKGIPPRIIAEKYINELGSDNLIDYKFYCFNGIPSLCQVIMRQNGKQVYNMFYDKDWILCDFYKTQGEINDKNYSNIIVDKPPLFNRMLEIAKSLSKNIPYIRVDLYNLAGKIYFGELTFYPYGGMGYFHPDEWDYKLGDLIVLPKKSK